VSLVIPQLMLCPSVPGADDKDVLSSLLSSATAAERGRHNWDSGLEEKSIQAICSHSQLNSQQALCLLEPLKELQDICHQGGLNLVGVGRALAEDCHCCSQRALIL
jgi:hypothetical protein